MFRYVFNNNKDSFTPQRAAALLGLGVTWKGHGVFTVTPTHYVFTGYSETAGDFFKAIAPLRSWDRREYWKFLDPYEDLPGEMVFWHEDGIHPAKVPSKAAESLWRDVREFLIRVN